MMTDNVIVPDKPDIGPSLLSPTAGTKD